MARRFGESYLDRGFSAASAGVVLVAVVLSGLDIFSSAIKRCGANRVLVTWTPHLCSGLGLDLDLSTSAVSCSRGYPAPLSLEP